MPEQGQIRAVDGQCHIFLNTGRWLRLEWVDISRLVNLPAEVRAELRDLPHGSVIDPHVLRDEKRVVVLVAGGGAAINDATLDAILREASLTPIEEETQ